MRRSVTRSRLRAALLRLALLAGAGGVALLVAEFAIRLVQPQVVMEVTPGLYQDDPPGTYRLAPGHRGTLGNRVEFATTVAVNADGLRGSEVPPREAGRHRLLAVGDSFTFGVGVEADEAWPARLATALGERGWPAAALNAGAPGYGVPDAVTWVERHGTSLAPDLVVLGVFVGNDLQDAAPSAPQFEVVDGQLVQAGARPGLQSWLYGHSHLYVLLKNAVPAGVQAPIRRALGLAEPWTVQSLRLELDLFRPAPTAIVREGADATARALDTLVGLAAARGFRVAAVLVPPLVQVDDVAWNGVLAELGVDAAAYDRDAPTRLFRALLAARGIPVVDPTPALRQAVAAGERVYYPIDRHLTAAGHALVARVAAEALAPSLTTAPAAPNGPP